MIARTVRNASNAHTAPVVITATRARIAGTANGVADVTTYGTTKTAKTKIAPATKPMTITKTKTKSVLNNKHSRPHRAAFKRRN